MKPIAETTVLVWDNGLGLPIAERLARDVKRCIYFSPWQKERTINAAIIGDGLATVERCRDPWLIKKEVDAFIFPDVGFTGEQIELRSQGLAVWGAGRAERLETDREYFLKTLASVGLEVPPHEIVVGITALRSHLKDREDCWIKISHFRGTFETQHWRSWKLDENLTDLWAIQFGAVRELVRFIVCDPIETKLEIGVDTFNVRGQWPDAMLSGTEFKDKAYFASVMERDEMPDEVRAVNEAFAPILERFGYVNEWSAEIRVQEDHFYFTDATTRLGLPSTGSQLELWDNISEIIIAGAHGELVQPKPNAKFSAELIVSAKSQGPVWATSDIPDELRSWLKLADSCEYEGVRYFPREGDDDEHVGWLICTGQTPEETIETMKGYVKLLPEGLSCDIAPLADVLKEIEVAKEKGIDLIQKPIPEPSSVLQT